MSNCVYIPLDMNDAPRSQLFPANFDSIYDMFNLTPILT